MLADLRRTLPSLTHATVLARAGGQPTYDVAETAAADNVRALRDRAGRARRAAAGRARTTARRVPGEQAVEGEVRGARASSRDLPLEDYDRLNAGQVVTQLTDLSQLQLRTVAAYERRHRNRRSVLERIEALEGEEPWTGYDDLDDGAVIERLRATDEATVARVREYEGRHRRRVAVLEAAQHELSRSS